MMECSCDAEYPDVYDESDVIARKEHTCCECDSPIDKGEKYTRIKGLWDGKWEEYKQCETCNYFFHHYSEYSHCMPLGQIWNWIAHLE